MTYFFTSYWKRQGDQKLHLAGILAVGGGKLAVSFPSDKDEQDDWSEIAHEINEQSGFFSTVPPRVWLSQIARRGNGVTDDYGPVGQLEAASMEEALEQAFRRSGLLPQTSPEVIKPEQPDFYDFGNPLAALLPDSLLRPGRAPAEAPVVREELSVGKRQVQRSGVRLHKEARVVKEIGVGRAATDHVETMQNTARSKTE